MKRPNILVILCDQWRAQATGYAGDPNVSTPHLDALAGESLNCVNAVANCPVCTPARATLLTGQYAHRHGLIVNDTRLDPDLPSLGKSLAAGGYQTGWIGKWHVDGHGRRGYIPPDRRQGFEFWKTLECTHNYWESPYYDGDEKELSWWSGPKTDCDYDAFAQTDAAIDFLSGADARRDPQRPFALCVSFGPPHDPYHKVPQRFLDLYPKNTLKLRPNVPPKHEEGARNSLQGYYAHCTALDECIGRIEAALAESGQRDNTLVLFTSDHGDCLNSHGYWFKEVPWDESACIPFLMRWPTGLGSLGRKIDASISLADVMPTLLGLTGLDIPEAVQGADFSRHLLGEESSDPVDGAAYLQLPIPFGSLVEQGGPAAREWRALRTRTHTYARTLDGPWLLYDNAADPYQLFNLVDDPRHAGLLKRLDNQLQQRMRQLGDELIPGQQMAERFGYTLGEKNLIESFAEDTAT